jgi:hypothetical protein
MSRRSHPKSEIESALKYAEQNGWHIDLGGSHAWGKIYCPYNSKECGKCGLGVSPSEAPFQESRCGIFCISSIWSTPKNSGNHAKQIRQIVDNCTKHNYTEPPSEEEQEEEEA